MADPLNKVAPLRRPVPCPNCGEKSHRETYPFCSKRCADVDLNRWFSESYTVPAESHGDLDDSVQDS